MAASRSLGRVPSINTARFLTTNSRASIAGAGAGARPAAFTVHHRPASASGGALHLPRTHRTASAGHRRVLATAAAADGQPQGASGSGKKVKPKKEPSVYGHTVLLPKTDFEMRANSVAKEPMIQQYWADNKVYETIAERDAEMFTLHDGPPYANGDLHIGHALNKILKDFINRYEMLKGKKVRFVPGWDCHGLPIELKVLQSMEADKRLELTPIKLRKKARAFALKAVEAQREQFKRYGIWADWEDPYLTLLPEYEGAQMEVFGQMFLNGHIYRGKKPVHWSPSSMTALAEAELEYPPGHVSQSVYVAFPLDPEAPLPAAFPAEHASAVQNASLAIWTTTPWTMPANAAVAVNDKLRYSFAKVTGVAANKAGVEAEGGAPPTSAAAAANDPASMVGRTLIIGEDLVGAVGALWGLELHTLCTVTGAELEGLIYTHPMYGPERKSPVVVGGDYITTESGTGLVHTAPGHGQEDYITGLKFGLPLLSPVDDAGDFTAEAGPGLAGKNVLGDGNVACIEGLRACGALILQEAYPHKYPYDWRTKEPTIFRATEQWFASVEGFRDEALAELEKIKFIPASGSKRMTPMVAGRNDWCISRQRAWGVPIPCFYDKETKVVLMDEATITHVTEIVRSKGTDAWWEMELVDLLPDQYKHRADSLIKGTDTMDVWFDSGSSWAGVVKARGLAYPANLYLEGSDQHRGWFQSSLLTGVAATGKAPYKTILTHGFVLDEKGYKMSKSLGNVVDPRLIIEGGKNQKTDPAFGADTLRLWVASTDYTSDVLIGMNILKQTSDNYRKLRGTLRFLMGNIGDFDPAANAVPYEELPAFDRYALYRTAAMVKEMEVAYETYAYSTAVSTLQSFTTFLSNVYLDVSKDRLYIESPSSAERRACQTVVAGVVERLLSCIAPVTPHMAEEAWMALPYAKEAGSVFLSGWAPAPSQWTTGIDESEIQFWTGVLAIRGEVNKSLEAARNDKLIGASLQAKAVVYAADADFAAQLESRKAELKQAFIVSEVVVVHTQEELMAVCVTTAGLEGEAAEGVCAGGVTVGVARAAGTKCVRCWGYTTDAGADDRHPELCARCTPIVIAADPELRAPAKGAEAAAVV
eukprot:CAMPEP_0181385712 /NCGR_PEP_ID=MMETSP1106-20121128/22716_1 /TAXON_ID=81844 /ORGANISM="Mantoniella antarctica, Strain SL-175" /LENGTH=1100 /DNA_ID=CAMNT_0023505811 /DNA_START=222 /DNA_END=3524 /DNA_ORIENTATION=-